MVKSIKFLVAVALFLIIIPLAANANGEVEIQAFGLSPTTVLTTAGTGTTQFQVTLSGTINLSAFDSECDSNSFAWYIYSGSEFKRFSDTYTFDRTQNPLPFNINQNITVSITAPEFRGGTFDYYAKIFCSTSIFDHEVLGESNKIPITFGTGSTPNQKWACVVGPDSNGGYSYFCSPSNLNNCSDVPECSGRACIEIGNNLCGRQAPTPTLIPTPTSTPGETQTFDFSLDNPLEADNLVELINVIATWLLNIAIPIAVAMIVYAGVLFLVSRGDTAKVVQAKKILLYAVVGFSIILIGKGFITLIESILNLGTGP